MWPQVKQFESYERVPFEQFAEPGSGHRPPGGPRRPRRVATRAAVLAIVLASSGYLVAASAVGDAAPPSRCAPAGRDTGGTPSRVLCALANAVSAPPGEHLHRWP